MRPILALLPLCLSLLLLLPSQLLILHHILLPSHYPLPSPHSDKPVTKLTILHILDVALKKLEKDVTTAMLKKIEEVRKELLDCDEDNFHYLVDEVGMLRRDLGRGPGYFR
ncbi:hypothetical protein BDN67DRAFT_985404 [Paxillus ammoniavirescens]|nr:hypothetical protein BDN67DRAFT_985404 [Paxillus ammoniavirescens]